MEQRNHIDWSDSASCAFHVVAGEFVVVTADASDLPPYRPVASLLKRVRKVFGIESAFIAEWAHGEPLVRRGHACDDGAPMECDALQALFGERLLEGRAGPAGASRFDAVPVITRDGVEHGTLCCLSKARPNDTDPTAQRDELRAVANLIAAWFDDADLSLSGVLPLSGSSMMGSLSGLAPLY
jgi:hypothetical protein